MPGSARLHDDLHVGFTLFDRNIHRHLQLHILGIIVLSVKDHMSPSVSSPVSGMSVPGPSKLAFILMSKPAVSAETLLRVYVCAMLIFIFIGPKGITSGVIALSGVLSRQDPALQRKLPPRGIVPPFIRQVGCTAPDQPTALDKEFQRLCMRGMPAITDIQIGNKDRI